MSDVDLEKYCKQAIENGSNHAKLIHPGSIVTAPWVRLKCQFGCPRYGRSYCCPPYTPTPQETRAIIDHYHRAILFHLEAPQTPNRKKRFKEYYEMLTDLEEEMFKDGYYKVFVFLAGPCHFLVISNRQDESVSCKECNVFNDKPCRHGGRARPSMEGCGIDVFQTAHNNSFSIPTLKEKTETQNIFCLMLVN